MLQGMDISHRTHDLGAILEQGRSPLPFVQEQVQNLSLGERVLFLVPFEPVPLYAHIESWGGRCEVERTPEGVRLTVIKVDAPTPVPLFLDLRRLPPPEPMQRTLESYSALAEGECLVVHLPHRPVHLLQLLEERQIAHEVHPQVDGSCQLYLLKGAS